MPRDDEFTPQTEQVEWLLKEVISPAIAPFAAELNVPSTVRLHIHEKGQDTLCLGDEDSYWRVRVIARRSFSPGELKIQIQAKVPRDPKSGFTGFCQKGAFSISSTIFSFRAKSHTSEYNIEGFREWS